MSRASKKRFGSIVAWGAAGLVLVFAASGCGAANHGDGAAVSGKVMYKGQPVTGGMMKLYVKDAPPVAGVTDPSIPITIKPDGTFTASNVPIGMMQVAIETESVKGIGRVAVDPATGMPPGATRSANFDPSRIKAPPAANPGSQGVYIAIPLKYAEPRTSELTWDVKAGSQTKNFDLTD